MKIIIGIKIIWSGNKLLPKAKNILIENTDKFRSIGMSNNFKNHTYRFYPYIKITK